MSLKNKVYFLGLFLGLQLACKPSSDTQATSEQDTSSPEASSQSQASEVNHDCNYCGMPTQDPDMVQWNGHLVHSEGEMWFCSPRCLLLIVKDSAKAPPNIEKLQLKDYYTTQSIMAQQAYFVTGSDVLGPMGHDLVPFTDEASAQEFLKEHQGEAIYPFAELDLELIKKVVQQN